jgi:hypothetical protein
MTNFTVSGAFIYTSHFFCVAKDFYSNKKIRLLHLEFEIHFCILSIMLFPWSQLKATMSAEDEAEMNNNSQTE